MAYRKVIRICAEDSPNVKARRVLFPGVLTWEEYQERRANWDTIRQCVGLDARFYEGAELRLFPREWLQRCWALADERSGRQRGRMTALGVDPGEGGAETAWVVVDELGLLELIADKTPDTNVIPERTLRIAQRWGTQDERIAFDRGGGGKQLVDRMRAMGHRSIRTVAFGEGISLDPRRGLNTVEMRLDTKEDRYAFVNRRAEMYGELSALCDPAAPGVGFAIPKCEHELNRQLLAFPKKYDGEGRLWLPPKTKKNPDAKEKCLTEILGCSPDRADALVLAVHALTHKAKRPVARVG